MACKRGVSFEIGSDGGLVRERNLKAEDVGGPWAAIDIDGIQAKYFKRRTIIVYIECTNYTNSNITDSPPRNGL